MLRRLLLALLLAPAPALAETRWFEDPPGERLTLPGPEREVLVAEIRKRVESPDPRRAAWGARMAADHALTEVAPALLERLVATDANDRDPTVLPLRAALVDALLRLDAPLNPWRLLPQASGWVQDGVVLFLLRHPVRYREVLLALFAGDGVGEGAWLALGNALASQRAPGFAARLLRRLTLRLRVRVWTGPPPRYREPGGSVCADGFVRWPPGFPPVVLHRLTARAGEPGDLVARGPRPVYRYRQVWEEREMGFGWSGPGLDRDVARLEWLGSLVPVPPALAAHAEADLAWGGVQPFVREVVARRARIEDAWRELARRLGARGLLLRDEGSDLVPRVLLEVQDHRRIETPALPAIP